MYEDEYYYEARKKENAKLDAELAGTFATVIGGFIIILYAYLYKRVACGYIHYSSFCNIHRINDFTTCVLGRKNNFYNLCKYSSCNNRCRLESI